MRPIDPGATTNTLDVRRGNTTSSSSVEFNSNLAAALVWLEFQERTKVTFASADSFNIKRLIYSFQLLNAVGNARS